LLSFKGLLVGETPQITILSPSRNPFFSLFQFALLFLTPCSTHLWTFQSRNASGQGSLGVLDVEHHFLSRTESHRLTRTFPPFRQMLLRTDGPLCVSVRTSTLSILFRKFSLLGFSSPRIEVLRVDPEGIPPLQPR